MNKLKITELAALLEESPHTIRNWLRDFRTYIKVEKAANGYNVFTPEAVEQFKLIKHLIRDRGFSTRQVAHHLATGEQITSSSVAAARPDEIAEIKNMISQLAAAQQEQINLQRAILERMDARDRQLTQFFIERREAAAAKQLPEPDNRLRRPWWKFWR